VWARWWQVVLYEDHSRKRLLDFLAALKGLREVAAAAAEFDQVEELESLSPRLAELVRNPRERHPSAHGVLACFAGWHPCAACLATDKRRRVGVVRYAA
jgi:hypothetical protein